MIDGGRWKVEIDTMWSVKKVLYTEKFTDW